MERRRPIHWEDVRRGETKGRDLPWRARVRLARFLVRVAHSLVR
jgi:hypothetical protein